MKTKSMSKLMMVLVILFVGVFLAACGGMPTQGASEAEPTQVPVVKADTAVVVEGRLVPRETVQLAFVTGGEVAEVLVEEGDVVKAGDVLARLGNQEGLEASIVAADLELLNAKQAVDKLQEQAEDAAIAAQRRIADFTRVIRDAQYQQDNFTVPTNQANLDPYEAVDLMKQNLDKAREAFEPYRNKASGDSTRKNLKEKLDNAQSDYNAAVRRLEYYVRLETAEADLEKAINDYKVYSAGPKQADVEAAQARVAAAEAALTTAKAALDNLELVATIDGTVVDLNLIAGEQAVAFQPVIQLADFSEWYVETDNLTEIEVVNISLGQKAVVVADALSDQELSGVVDSINDLYEEKRGDITYTARILLDEIDPLLRWGMTVIVTFEQ